MFNKFSNPEEFIPGYQEQLTETVIAPPSNESSGDSSVHYQNSVASNTKARSIKKRTSTPSPQPQPQIPMNEVTETTLQELTQLNETPTAHKDRVKNLMMEYMELDYTTTSQLFSLNEAEQNTFLLSLTNKLYQMIISKIDDVDFGDIPNSKGNVRRYTKYKQLRDCIDILEGIFTEYKENTEPVKVLDNALSNLENNSDIFMAGYASDIALVKMTYEATTLGVITGIGFMISTCIEYIKTPKKEGLNIVLDKNGIRKVKDHIIYENLVKFNNACGSGELDKALRPLIKDKVKDLAFLGISIGVRAIIAIGVVITAIIPFLRQLVYFFYASRVRMSTYLDAQADLLEMNATELRGNDSIQTAGDKQRVIARQLKIAKFFHATANKIAVDAKQSENQATKELSEDKRRYKMDEVNSNPSTTAVSGPLF